MKSAGPASFPRHTGQVEATDHLKASLLAAIALGNTFGSAWRQGRPAAAPEADTVRDVLRLTTNQPVEVDVTAFASGGRRLYDALGHLPEGDVDAAVQVVNELLKATKAAPQLTRHEDAPWHLHFGRPDEATGWIAEFATATAMLLGSDDVDRLRRCEGGEMRGSVPGLDPEPHAAVLLNGLPEPHQGRRSPRPIRLISSRSP